MPEKHTRLLWAGNYEDQKFAIKEHAHEYHQLFYITKGNIEIGIDEEVRTVSCGGAVLVKSGSTHSMRSEEPLAFFDIKFTCQSLDMNDIPVWLELNERQSEIIACIMQEFEQKALYYHDICDGFMNIFVFELMRAMHAKLESEGTVFNKIVNYVQKSYKNAIRFDNLAKDVDNNKNYLCTAFKKEAGMTISEYIYDMRAKKAGELLCCSDYSISHIAVATGFKTIHHFNRVFSGIMGVPPGKYRRDNLDRFELYDKAAQPILQ